MYPLGPTLCVLLQPSAPIAELPRTGRLYPRKGTRFRVQKWPWVFLQGSHQVRLGEGQKGARVRLYRLFVAGYAQRACLVLHRQCARTGGESMREMLSEKRALQPQAVGD